MSTAKNTLKRDRPSSPVIPDGPLGLRLEWSDGTATFGDGVNGPTEDMLDPTPDEQGACNYMRAVEKHSKKELHWKFKLAEELAKNKDPALAKKVGKKLIMEELPEGYRLFEQVQTPGPGAGGKSRTDTYLYGHPKGPRKRFRSPGDFLPHLIWLATDLTKNPANCPCRACKGNAGEPVAEKPESPRAAGRAATPKIAAARPKSVASTAPATAPRKVAQPQPRRSVSTSAAPQATAVRQPQPQPVLQQPGVPKPPELFRPSEPQASAAVLLQCPSYSERQRDLQHQDLCIYRLGEQIWVQTGPHWALGVITALPPVGKENSGYTIQPLNSPWTCEQTLPHHGIKPQDIRPWVAWSTPPVTSPLLQDTNTEYENLPWHQVQHASSLEVDASIIKARAVDSSYTLIDRLGGSNQYAGIYHGAEKFWIGDAVRLKATALQDHGMVNGTEILYVMGIQDGAPPMPYPHGRTKESGIFVTGDIYRLMTVPTPVANPGSLPRVVMLDSVVRAKITEGNPTQPHVTYAPVATGVHIRLDDVKGRWYPTSSLYRIMHGDVAFKSMIQQKRWEESGGKMNEMGNAGHVASRGWMRYVHRHEAFAKSIPAHIVFPPTRAGVPMQPQELAQEMHAVDLAAADDENTGMEFLADEPQEEAEDELLKGMGEDAGSFLANNGDEFYGGL